MLKSNRVRSKSKRKRNINLHNSDHASEKDDHLKTELKKSQAYLELERPIDSEQQTLA